MIRIRANHDGTYTIYRNQQALMCGLTRQQAEEFARHVGAQLR